MSREKYLDQIIKEIGDKQKKKYPEDIFTMDKSVEELREEAKRLIEDDLSKKTKPIKKKEVKIYLN